ncbi:MAG: oligosaccharide flippase family protein [Steroidobacteraceae bacterium]
MVASTLIAGVVGLVLALLHFGVWALVWQAIVLRSLSAGMLWALVPLRFRVGFSIAHFRELVRYAAPLVLSQSMAWGTGQFPRSFWESSWEPANLESSVSQRGLTRSY